MIATMSPAPVKEKEFSLLFLIAFSPKEKKTKKKMQKRLFFPFLESVGDIYREGNGNPFQYSCLENPMNGGAW